MAKKNKPAPSSGLTLTAPALLFAGGMLVLGAVGGYMVGKAQGIVEGGDSSAAGAEAASDAEPRGKVVNKTGGELRRLSEDEKKKLLSDNKARGTAKDPGPAPVDSPFMAEDILSGITDPVQRQDYQRAVTYMTKGNARAARPTLVRLAQDATGTKLEEPVAALLCDAQASVGDVREARKSIETFKTKWPKSAHLAQVWLADGKSHMHEGKRMKRAPGQAADAPANDDQKKSYREAVSRFDTLLKSFSSHPAAVDALLNKSALLVELGDMSGAETAALRLADDHPTTKQAPRALSNVARRAMGAGDYEAAGRLYQAIVAKFPQDRAAKGAQGQLKSLKMLGKVAPSIEVSEWLGENYGSLEELRGKNVALVFWATWCPACRRTMPKIQEFYDRNKGDDFVMIALTRHSKGQTTQAVMEYMKENGYTMPVAVDPGSSSRAYGVTGIPAGAIINKEGKVVFRGHPANFSDDLLKR